MFCPKCGKQLEDNVKFCDGCGTKVADEAAATVVTGGAGFGSAVKPSLGGLKVGAKGKMDIIGLIAAAISFIALFLPYASVSLFGYSESISLMDAGGDGIIAVVLLIAFIALNVLGFAAIKNIVGIAYLVIIAIIAFNVTSTVKKELGGFSDVVNYEIGFWLLLITAVVIAASGLVKKYLLKK